MQLKLLFFKLLSTMTKVINFYFYLPCSALSQHPYSILQQDSLVSIQVWMNSKEEQRKTTRMIQICLSNSTTSEGFKYVTSGKSSFLCKYITHEKWKKSATMHQTTKWLAKLVTMQYTSTNFVLVQSWIKKVKTSCILSWKPTQSCMKT